MCSVNPVSDSSHASPLGRSGESSPLNVEIKPTGIHNILAVKQMVYACGLGKAQDVTSVMSS